VCVFYYCVCVPFIVNQTQGACHPAKLELCVLLLQELEFSTMPESQYTSTNFSTTFEFQYVCGLDKVVIKSLKSAKKLGD
jgi:hypothetical protein